MDDLDVGGLAEGIGDLAEGVVGIGATKRNGDPNWGCLFVILALAVVAIVLFASNCDEKKEVKSALEDQPRIELRPDDSKPIDW